MLGLDLDATKLAEFANSHKLAFIALFGSQARGSSRPGSDVDIAVMPLDSAAKSDRLSCTLEMCRELHRGDLDATWLPHASWLLEERVARDGVPLYERLPGEFAAFRAAARLRAMDSWPWRKRDELYLQGYLHGRKAMDEALIREKLKQMAEYLSLLSAILKVSADQFAAEPMRKHSGERLLELIVECATSINSEISQAQNIPATDYYSSFFALAQAGWITQDLAAMLAPYASLRNRLVHQYERLDVTTLHQTLANCHEHWKQYITAVQSCFHRASRARSAGEMNSLRSTT
jgi:uncharacterized protein YutE (UPF0331/DUF86 family)